MLIVLIQNLHIFYLQSLFLFFTFFKVFKKGIDYFISLTLIIVNLKVILFV